MKSPQEMPRYAKDIEAMLLADPARASHSLFQAYQSAYNKEAFAAALVAALVLERTMAALP